MKVRITREKLRAAVDQLGFHLYMAPLKPMTEENRCELHELPATLEVEAEPVRPRREKRGSYRAPLYVNVFRCTVCNAPAISDSSDATICWDCYGAQP